MRYKLIRGVVFSMDSKEIFAIPDEYFIQMWDSGLGIDFVKANPQNMKINKIPYYTDKYLNGVRSNLTIAILLFISIIIVVLAFVCVPNHHMNHFQVKSLASIFILPLADYCWKSQKEFKKNYKAYKKLKELDLTAFYVEDYAPEINEIKFASLEWACKNNLLSYENNSYCYCNKRL
ncbi:hypothetical protein MSL71_24290 [Desulfoluna butyratoxydans]|uniref:Uncharacterized protein n=2 Tax=Desulfoluna butyratoxydans TaxID=231438 RepID=A0A4U8YSF9_9BACT|nr:hypothetical protein MSL71_24290 [Desulfoluna butyratoxydans]